MKGGGRKERRWEEFGKEEDIQNLEGKGLEREGAGRQGEIYGRRECVGNVMRQLTPYRQRNASTVSRHWAFTKLLSS